MNKHHIPYDNTDAVRRPNHHRYSTGMRRLICLACVLLLTLSLFPAVNSEESDSAPIKVGYFENEIFQEGAADGVVKSGYAYEYYRKLSEYTGWQYEYVYGDFSELLQKLINGEIDLMAGLAYSKERDGLIGYPNEVMGHENYILIKHDSDVQVTADPATMNGKSVGVLEGVIENTLNDYLAKYSVNAEVKPYPDYTVLFEAFDNNELDILAAETDGTYGRKDAEVLTQFGETYLYMCTNINRPELLEQLNSAQAMMSVEEPNYIHSLENKYFPVSISNKSFTDPEEEWLASHDSICVGYLDNYLPYTDMDENGNVTGLIKNLIPAIFDNLETPDIDISYKAYTNYDDMITDINNDVIDIAFPVGGGLYYSEESGIYQSTPVITTSSNLVYKGELDEETTSNFGVNRNNSMQYNNIVTNYPDAELTFYPSSEDCLDAVIKGEVTCTLINGMRAVPLLRNSKYDKLSIQQLSATEDCCFGVKIGNEGLLKLLNRGISILGDNYIRNMAYPYTAGLYSYTMMDAIRENIALVVAGISLLASIIIFLLVRDSIRKRKQIAATEEARRELAEKNEELAESQQALSDALIAAEHANRAKTSFLNNMSHDIRTPMNAIVGFTAMAAAHIDEKDKVQNYLSQISVSSRHLLSLINDVLDMSRIESGKMKIEETDVHLPDVIHDLRTIIQPNVKSKQQELYIDTQDVKNEDIITDKLRLNQVLINILTNAVKFTPAGGTVSFRVIEKPSSQDGMTNFEFRVKDNGIGMTDEFKETIFEAFTREQNSTVSGIQGTGLGMAITKNIVDLMGGTIEVFSEVGKGSEFIVNISCKLSDSKVQQKTLPELEGLRALVADDDTNTCLSVCAMLRDIGMRPDWTNYGKEAVIRAKEAYDQSDKFRVYIIDWMMPDLNGIETVRRIRKVIGDSDPIIVMTAYDWTDIEKEAREAGVTAFCSKPLFMSELRDILSQPFRVKDDKPEQDENPYNFSGRRVLLAEDNELNQMIAVSILEGAGFEVDIAEDGQEAVEKIEAVPADHYDVVLMDIQMPRMDGYEAAGRIRAMDDKQKASIPIIAVTANAFEEDRKIALEAGMNGHLAKPYDIPEMMKTIDAVLSPKDSAD